MSTGPVTIAVVAGEASSDLIGADLIRDLQRLNPGCQFVAVGGRHIKATGAELIQDNEVFSVMGLAEVLKDLPRLLKTKKQVVRTILSSKPDLFIGVDSPDLNFSIAKAMKKHGVPVIHYVSPSVWAWRPGRVHKMARFIDGLLTLFPFEVECYSGTGIDARFVGHPLAKQIPLQVDKQRSRAQLGLSDKKILALLPGSRNREIKELTPVFAETVRKLNTSDEWQVVSSNVSEAKQKQVAKLAAEQQLELNFVDDTSALLQAADFALLGSGTVALEALLSKTPMVVAYRISPITWWLVKTFRMMQLPYYSLPNVLAGDFLVPEVMQNDLTTDNLLTACREVINDPQAEQRMMQFHHIHQSLLTAQPDQAARAVLNLAESLC
ncbi:lipid-A-disaccharide synthase [Marinicella sediminis]|uniref:Lipid-A-disaccharide synthase n=1 Tax=Marinicella sediminis TaxID=1792834 RepID=A0ABV7J882_9GAMM|nr:lipid-A-disaccharide synthase [Marinicella sediminis]